MIKNNAVNLLNKTYVSHKNGTIKISKYNQVPKKIMMNRLLESYLINNDTKNKLSDNTEF